MSPVLHASDVLLAQRLSCGRPVPKRGDIVVYGAPLPDGRIPFNVKRIAGVPGEMVGSDITLGPNSFWVLGDNRAHSGDSRHTGPVNLDQVRGIGLAVVRGRLLLPVHVRPRRSGRPARWAEAIGDWRRGVQTRGAVFSSELGIPEHVGNMYEPAPWNVLRGVVNRSELARADVFLDVGCGKGRVMLAALELGFRDVVGIDISPRLVNIARSNLARVAKSRRCGVELTAGDATATVMSDRATYVFLFNPFTSAALRRFLDQLDASLCRAPRDLRIITHHVLDEAAVLERGFLVIRRAHDTVLFERLASWSNMLHRGSVEQEKT